MNQDLPRTLKGLAVEVNVPVRELVKLYSQIGIKFPNKPSVKLDPEHIELILPSIKEYLARPFPVSKKTRKKMKRKPRVSGKQRKEIGKKKMSKQVEKEIMLSLDGFGSKAPKKPNKKTKFSPKKPIIISTPMKG